MIHAVGAAEKGAGGFKGEPLYAALRLNKISAIYI
jgi:hypothetical protein